MKGILPWALAAALAVAGVAVYWTLSGNLHRTKTDLSAMSATSAGQAKQIKDLQGQVRDLTSQNETLTSQNGDLTTSNSDLRAAAQSCENSAFLNRQALRGFVAYLNGQGFLDGVLTRLRNASSAAQDCQNRFNALGLA